MVPAKKQRRLRRSSLRESGDRAEIRARQQRASRARRQQRRALQRQTQQRASLRRHQTHRRMCSTTLENTPDDIWLEHTIGSPEECQFCYGLLWPSEFFVLRRCFLMSHLFLFALPIPAIIYGEGLHSIGFCTVYPALLLHWKLAPVSLFSFSA